MPRGDRKKLQAAMTFHGAVEATPSIRGAGRPGLQALVRADRERIIDGTLATGSVALDEALLRADPHGNRWDYGIGLPPQAGRSGESVLWLEVHHAASGETEAVVKKLEWLKSWLREHAPRLDALPRKFVWQLSNVERHPNDRLRRNRLAEQHGLRRVEGRLRLADHTSSGPLGSE
jgi:hypothetical protein